MTVSLLDQIDGVNGEIATKRLALDKLLNQGDIGDEEWEEIDILKAEIEDLERCVSKARRWLESCGVAV